MLVVEERKAKHDREHVEEIVISRGHDQHLQKDLHVGSENTQRAQKHGAGEHGRVDDLDVKRNQHAELVKPSAAVQQQLMHVPS